MPEPKITVSILSWLLEDKLIETLTRLPRTTDQPLALCLQVQGAEQLSPAKRQAILDATSPYCIRDVFFTQGNNGAAKPRAELIKRSAKTPYVFFTDNDMTFQPGALDALLDFLEQPANASYGMIDLLNNYVKWHRRVEGTKVISIPVDYETPQVIDVDLIGAASILMRREVALLPGLIDTNYHLGVWDFDMCMNVRKAGWKIATLCDKRYIAVNDKTFRNIKYIRDKVRNPIRLNGVKRFRQKWGFCSETYPGPFANIEPPKPLADTLILTRAIYDSLGEVPDIGVLTQQRLEMMQRYFINSLKAQTNPDFTVFTFLGSPENETSKLIQSLDWSGLDARFIFTSGNMTEWKESVLVSQNYGREVDSGCPEDLARRSGHPTAPIMARLDNDDWAAPGWVAHMKFMANSIDEPRFLINYQVIGQWEDGRLYRFFAPHNRGRVSPFLAVVQREDPIVSPYEDLHLKMGRFFEHVYTVPPAYAFMVVHGTNRSNRWYNGDTFIGDPEKMTPLPEPPKKHKKVIDTRKNPVVALDDWRSRINASTMLKN